MTRLPRGELERSGDQDDHAAQSVLLAPAPAAASRSSPARRRPGERRSAATVQARRSRRHGAGQPTQPCRAKSAARQLPTAPGSSGRLDDSARLGTRQGRERGCRSGGEPPERSSDGLAVSATTLGSGTAASSPPSSRPTSRGTTPPRRATSVRASASTPSTSSSRQASASRPSPTWTRTRRSSPPRWQRRAALQTPKNVSTVGSHRSSSGNHRLAQIFSFRWRLRAAVVLVVATVPDAQLGGDQILGPSSRSVLWARGRATGTSPRGCPARVCTPSRCGRRGRPRARTRSFRRSHSTSSRPCHMTAIRVCGAPRSLRVSIARKFYGRLPTAAVPR